MAENTQADGTRTWADALRDLSTGSGIFGPKFLETHGAKLWSPTKGDRRAAHAFHVQLISRVATRPLGYGEGVERRALVSLFELFGHARDAEEGRPDCPIYEILAWHVLNERVRPFTAKWHARAEGGMLDALDASDEFRAELARVQIALTELDRVLRLVRGVEGYVPPPVQEDGMASIPKEPGLACWRPMGVGPVSQEGASLIGLAQAEREAVKARRRNYELDVERDWAAGIALSGGGIRSASFSLGVLTSLAKRNVLPRFDYLSTVSGGGYAGAFLTQLLGTTTVDDGFDLRADSKPFRRAEGETPILRRVRQNASYLAGGTIERSHLAFEQAAGLLINLLALSLVAGFVGWLDYLAGALVPAHWNVVGIAICAGVLIVGALYLPYGRSRRWEARPGRLLLSVAAVGLTVVLVRFGLDLVHETWRPFTRPPSAPGSKLTGVGGVTGWWVMGTAAVAFGVAGLVALPMRIRPVVLFASIVAQFVALENVSFDLSRHLGFWSSFAVLVGLLAVFGYLWFIRDVDATSLHGYYRRKLAAAFLLRSNGSVSEPLAMSAIDPARSLFPIVNCAVNLPGSTDPVMRGRRADVFSITPVSAGASVLGHHAVREWEKTNSELDLAGAMALSGAAVSPLSGSTTTRHAGFWLTLLNLRLGAWLRRPDASTDGRARPGIAYLAKEAVATARETDPFVHVSDGGHIENLGVYELLRRRCRYIVAVDGENDPEMTFHGLTNLQRLAYIDFGIVLELDLDDLRLGGSGYSRSHFRFCRILYPAGEQDRESEIGYLAYVKLSLTGNEGEFLRRVRLDEPAFPHHSTADQFFSETRFEAYRALGEHVGEKMFLPAIVGDIGIDVHVEEWFGRLGSSLLQRRPDRRTTEAAPTP